MARKRKGGQAGAAVDSAIASLDVGGPPISRKKRSMSSSTVPNVLASSRPGFSPHDTNPGPDSTINPSVASDPTTASGPNVVPINTAKSWGSYFSGVDLFNSLKKPIWKFNSSARKSLRQRFSRLVLAEYIAASFNLKTEMRNSKKAQPDEAYLPDFEDRNEPTLRLMQDSSCIIRDNSEAANPLVVKIGANQFSSPAVPHGLASELLFSTLTYC